jgi:hypothetical protein
MGHGIFNWIKIAAAAMAATAILAVACGGNGGSDEIDSLVPEGSTLIGDIDFAAVSAGLDWESLFNALPLEQEGPADFAAFFGGGQVKAGIEFRDVTNVEFFGNSADASEYFGVVVYGEFDEAAVIAEISAKGDGPLVPDVYKGNDIYTPENDPDSFTLSVLDSGTLALGTDRALKDIIDVRAGDRAVASGRLTKSLDDFGERLFGLVVQVPAGGASGLRVDPRSLLGDGSGLFGDLPFSLDFLDSMDMLGVAGLLKGENIGLTAVLDFENEEAAASTQQFVGGLLSVASSLTPDPQLQEILAGLEISQDGVRLTLGIDLPETVLFDLLGDLTTIASSTTTPREPVPAVPSN